MIESTENNIETDFERLESKIVSLLEMYHQLHQENEQLRQERDALREERVILIEKNAQARSRVEAMISRLKTMEQGVTS